MNKISPVRLSGPEPAPEKSSFQKGASTFLHLIIITAFGLLAYSNTFQVPFQFDDYSSIVNNPIIIKQTFFNKPSWSLLKLRSVGDFTFALNYRLNGLDVLGYHVINLAVHIVNAFLVYSLVILTFRTPFLSDSSLRGLSKYIALLSSLFFVSHPVQTQAVTYITQRLASLATMFYLLSLVTYIKSRLSTRTVLRFALYIVCFVSAVLAMKTKEIAFTLPLLIALYAFMFFKESLRRRLLYLIPLLLTMLIIPLSLLGIDRPIGEIIGDVSEVTKVHTEISRLDYLFTEFRVIVTYIRLLFLPVNQNLAYDYPVFRSLFNPQVFLSFLFLLSLICFAGYLFFRSRHTAYDLRVVSFGIFWFFITLSVESGIIPIADVIFEHRVYLPSVGVSIALMSGIFLLIKNQNKKIQAIAVSTLVLMTFVFSYATHARNKVWRSELSLWEDVVNKAPAKPGGHLNLGNAYRSEGRFDRAIQHYRLALKIRPDYADVYNNLGIAYSSKGMVDRAVERFRTALRFKPNDAEIHYNLASAYHSKGLFEKAIEHYRQALRLKRDMAEAHVNMGNAYDSLGLPDEAIEHYRLALRIRPDMAEAHYNLGIVFGSKGLMDRAIEHFHTALRLKPLDADTHYNLGVAYRASGLTDEAIKHYRAALKIKPDYAAAHLSLGEIYLENGFIDKARKELDAALLINPDDRQARKLLEYISKGQ